MRIPTVKLKYPNFKRIVCDNLGISETELPPKDCDELFRAVKFDTMKSNAVIVGGIILLIFLAFARSKGWISE